eukprot:XP_001696490.1 predicted protein [Chlamydomonas reinhardtii]
MPVAAAPAAPHPPSAAPPTLSSLLPDLQQLLAGRHWSQAVLAARQHLAVAAAAAIAARDVADTLPATREALRLLKQRFGRVFFTPGNHDLWLRPGLEDSCAGAGGAGNDSTSGSGLADSYAKLWALWDACDELGVEVVPAEVAPGVLVAPLLSWYRHTFDTADPVPGRLRFDSWCRWPVAEADVWQVMLRLNDVALAAIRTWRAARRGSTTPAPPNPLPAANDATTPAPHGITAPAASAPLPAAAAPAPADAMPPHRSSHGTIADEGCGSSSSTSISSTGNDPALPPLVITLTHFLPHPDLPFPRLPRELAKAVGCAELQHPTRGFPRHRQLQVLLLLLMALWLRGERAVEARPQQAVSGAVVGALPAAEAARLRAVLRCVWDPVRGLCSYGVDGEDGSELS